MESKASFHDFENPFMKLRTRLAGGSPDLKNAAPSSPLRKILRDQANGGASENKKNLESW
jgi:hypothetical protein